MILVSNEDQWGNSLNRLAERTEYSEEKTPASYLRKEHTGTNIGSKVLYNYKGRSDVADDLTVMSLYREDDKSITTSAPHTIINYGGKNNEALKFDTHGNVVKKMQWNQLVFERTIEYF